ncbi:MAG: hypothetical protein HOP29_18715 [Phycisphaerales bacterium]|nr:hypothetical protein [Phycisphaerales bacterium]
MPPDPDKPLSERDIDALLDRAAAERWIELALVPTEATWARNEWHGLGRPADRFFFLKRPLHAVPPKLLQLTGLTTLDLGNNNIGDEGAKALATLTGLTTLHLGDNNIGAEGAKALATLTGLTTLHLGDNNIGAEGAKALATLTGLTTLHLGGNNIGAEGAKALATLTGLTTLHLWNNKIGAEGAKALATLTGLTTLHLGDNNIGAEGAKALATLIGLTTLNLWSNNIGDEGAKALTTLTSLTTLHLGANKIRAKGAKALAAITGLTTLHLGGNKIGGEGAKALAALTALNTLDLRSNNIGSEGAKALATLPETVNIDLGGNPCSQADFDVYRRALHEKSPLREVKVLILGEGNVGKSCLLDAFQGKPFVEKRDSTRGIDIERVVQVTPVPVKGKPGDRDLVLNCWDFGGQEHYHTTHQLFFSPDAVYLLVWKPREGQHENTLRAWLKRIALRVGSSARVILVATHGNHRAAELDFPRLEREFPGLLVHPAAKIDSSDKSGVEELRQRVIELAADVPHLATPLPKSWHDAREELLNRPESHVAYGDYTAMCAKHGLDDAAAGALLRMLNRAGLIVHYENEGLSDWIVRDPEWLTKSIGYVLDDEVTRKNGGYLDHARLHEIWTWKDRDNRNDPYDRDDYPRFLRLMELHDISRRLPGDRTSIITQLVTYERPPLPWEPATPTDSMQLSLRFAMTDEAPLGLIAWFTARCHRWRVDRMQWRDGVFLNHEHGNEALVELSDDKKLLTLTVRGPFPSAFLNLLRDGLEVLIREEWPNLKYELLIPCPGDTKEPAPCPDHGTFKLHKVEQAFRKQIESIQCTDCFVQHLPDRLLLGFVPPTRAPADVFDELTVRIAAAVAGLDAATAAVRADSASFRAATDSFRAATVRERSSANLSAHIADDVDKKLAPAFAALRNELTYNTRWILRTMLSPANDGPRLFHVEPVEKKGWERFKLGTDKLRIVLWCEHTGHEHPCECDPLYVVDQPKRWLIRIAPTLSIVTKILRPSVSILAAAAGLPIPYLPADLKPKLDFMASLTDALVKDHDPNESSEFGGYRPDERLTLDDVRGRGYDPIVEGYRQVQRFISEQDEKRNVAPFAGLRRVATPENDILWVCPTHHREYDPGLPIVPPA